MRNLARPAEFESATSAFGELSAIPFMLILLGIFSTFPHEQTKNLSL
jgi:uncharacterized membrane protein